MQIPGNPVESQVVNQTRVAHAVEEKNSASISLKTQEGDVVNLSFNNLNKYSESASKTEMQDGTTVGEFSVVAVSASKYSMSVQGNLNENEMAAIQKMADAITPIAQSFFTQGNSADLELAAQSLAGAMGVIQEANVTLEQTVTKTASESQITTQENNPQPPAMADTKSAQNQEGIRNSEALANAVVDSVFQKEGSKVPQNDPMILRGLSDLMDFLKKQLHEFLSKLSQAKEQPPQTPADSPAPAVSQAASQPDDKKTADTTPAPLKV